MGSQDTQYNPDFELPHLMEQRAETIRCAVYRDSALAAFTPAGSTVKLFNASGVSVADEQPSDNAGVAQLVLPAPTMTAQTYGLNWWAEWHLLMPDGVVHMFRNDAALVRARMYPTVNTIQLFRRLRALDPAQADVITRMTAADYQAKLDEVDIEVQLRMLEDDLRPGRVFSPSSLRRVWMSLWISLIFEDLASRRNEYDVVATTWRQRYEHAYQALTVVYDGGGGDPTANRRRSARSSLWLMDRS